MLDLSAAAKLEKNKISSTGAWIVLLEVQFQGATIKICNNNENIEWPTGSGQEWIAFPFELGNVTEDSKGELPQLSVKISNVTGSMQQYVEQYSGGTDATVILRVVHSEHLDNPVSELPDQHFTVKKTTADNYWVTFTLGPDYTLTQCVPPNKYRKNFCPYKFKRIECGYSGVATECNRTLGRCRELGNSKRFGGEPGIPGVPAYA